MEEEKTRAKKRSETLLRARTRSRINNGASPQLDKKEKKQDEKTENDTTPAGGGASLTGEKETSPNRSGEGGRKRKNSASSGTGGNSKKTRMDEEMRSFMADVRTRLSEIPTRTQFEDYNNRIRLNSDNIDANKNKIDEHEQQLASVRNSIERLEQEQVHAKRSLASNIEKTVAARTGARGSSDRELDEEYDRARKSIRIWPIEGSGEELRTNVAAFLANALGIAGITNFKAYRPAEENAPGYNGPVYSEVIVEFAELNARDGVAGRGTRLGGYVDAERKPTCGMRMEIPKHLVPTFRILHRYGMGLRRKIGTELKKYIKFDDFHRTIFIQIKPNRDAEWMNVTAEEADASLRRENARRTESLRSLLSPDADVGGGNRRRSASVSVMNESFSTPTSAPVAGNLPTWKPPARPKV